MVSPPSGLLGVVVLCLAPALDAQQAWTDGTTTFVSGFHTRAAVFDPPLPPNSTELAYDDGFYTGSSRNLQNANIFPGWPYWAQAVRFTPVGAATGQLLEVRYVAAVQWGANRDFDLLVRDRSGLVLGILQNQSAVLDTSTWQILDVRSLGIQVGSADFTVELRAANPCGGDTGFTIAYSLPATGESSVSDDCADTFLSFLPESRNLFVRAVVENAVGPTLSISTLVAGNSATLTAGSLTPNRIAWVARSMVGGGPWSSPFGIADLTPPITSFPLLADAQGDATLNFIVPLQLSGSLLWLQVYDSGSQTLGQSIATQVL